MRHPSDEWLEDWEDAAERGSLTADAEEIIDEDIDGRGGVSAGNGAGPGGPGGVSGSGERELVGVGSRRWPHLRAGPGGAGGPDRPVTAWRCAAPRPASPYRPRRTRSPPSTSRSPRSSLRSSCR